MSSAGTNLICDVKYSILYFLVDFLGCLNESFFYICCCFSRSLHEYQTMFFGEGLALSMEKEYSETREISQRMVLITNLHKKHKCLKKCSYAQNFET